MHPRSVIMIKHYKISRHRGHSTNRLCTDGPVSHKGAPQYIHTSCPAGTYDRVLLCLKTVANISLKSDFDLVQPHCLPSSRCSNKSDKESGGSHHTKR